MDKPSFSSKDFSCITLRRKVLRGILTLKAKLAGWKQQERPENQTHARDTPEVWKIQCNFSQVLIQQTKKKWKSAQETTTSEKGFWINAAAKQTPGPASSIRDWSLVLTYRSNFYIYQWTVSSFLIKVSLKESQTQLIIFTQVTDQIPWVRGEKSHLRAKSWEPSTPFFFGLHGKLQTSYKYTCRI